MFRAFHLNACLFIDMIYNIRSSKLRNFLVGGRTLTKFLCVSKRIKERKYSHSRIWLRFFDVKSRKSDSMFTNNERKCRFGKHPNLHNARCETISVT